jgi:hypothetical protein
MPKAPWMSGIATFTMVVVKTIEMVPLITATTASQR